MLAIISKVCTGCGFEKKATEFYACASHRDSLQSQCKRCKSLYIKYHYNKNKSCYLD